MNADQERILGYFLEEAEEHIQTLVGGIDRLKEISTDEELIQELFRAAHSIKGSAAMVGVKAMQKIAHRLEDFFKILRDDVSITIDDRLQVLFHRAVSTLEGLVHELRGNLSISEDTTVIAIAETEPIFAELGSHLEFLIAHQTTAPLPNFDPLVETFRDRLTAQLHEMLELFKLNDMDANRAQLLRIVGEIAGYGSQFQLPAWVELLQKIEKVIANSQNTAASLAPVVIRDLKSAQDLVLSNHPEGIVASTQLHALLPIPLSDDEEISMIFGVSEDLESGTEFADLSLLTADNSDEGDLILDWEATEEPVAAIESLDLDEGPRVGESELRSLANLFESDDMLLDLGDMNAEVPSVATEIIEPSTSSATDLDDLLTDSVTDSSDDATMAELFGEDFASQMVTEEAEINFDIGSEEGDPFGLEHGDSPIDPAALASETGEEPDFDLLLDGDSTDEEIDFGSDFAMVTEPLTPHDQAELDLVGQDVHSGQGSELEEELDLSGDLDGLDFTDVSVDDLLSPQPVHDLGSDLGNELGESFTEDFESVPTDASDASLASADEALLDFGDGYSELGEYLSDSVTDGLVGLDANGDGMDEVNGDADAPFDFNEDITAPESEVTGEPTDYGLADSITFEELPANVFEPESGEPATASQEEFGFLDSPFELDEDISLLDEGVTGVASAIATESELDQAFLDELDAISEDVPTAVTPEFEDFLPLESDDEGLEVLDSLIEQNAVESVEVPMPKADQTIEFLGDFFDSGDSGETVLQDMPETSMFDDLAALIGELPAPAPEPTPIKPAESKSEFDDLENALKATFGSDSGPLITAPTATPRRTTKKVTETVMRVDVKHLDSLNNLVGELVVNRNLLQQEQDRLQSSIGSLLSYVQQLSEVSQKMRDQYDRSILESSLKMGRNRTKSPFESGGQGSEESQGSEIVEKFEGDELDRYTDFHVLSQEIIELIVRIRESASDIQFVVGETEQVTRQLGTITTQVQDDLKQSRMVSFSNVADRLPRGVLERCLSTGKQADLEVQGKETLIDKTILDVLSSPLNHLVNNSVDHGLEDPALRIANGKPAKGKILVRAYHQGNQTVISVSDDGAGINVTKVKQKAVTKGLKTQSEVDRMTDNEAYDLLFHPGFSTRDKADDFAGRGVGLDVVKTALDDIRGSIVVESNVGKGTSFTIRLPLTLSISKAMFCISDRGRIAFPVDGFKEVVEVPVDQLKADETGQRMLQWKDLTLPIVPLGTLLHYNRHISRSNIYGKQENDEACILVLENSGSHLAVQVDQFIGEFEIVIKQLEGPVPKPAGIAGVTVLGDGKVMAIANALELFDIAAGRLRPTRGERVDRPEIEEALETDPTVLIVDDSITVRELLSMTFSKVGYRVEQAKDGQDAWDKLRAGLPCDLIFCDVEMPRMSGLDLLARLQKDPHLSQIPMAMLTSRSSQRHIQTAVELGAKGYFTKPYLEEELLSASQRLLKGEMLVTNVTNVGSV
ncbi:MAG: response regulator [Oscillatoriales cyanobacterium SM2_2_1]|nr:response regulator [Oscillatoriales cyanobacterium SM2_2_1]